MDSLFPKAEERHVWRKRRSASGTGPVELQTRCWEEASAVAGRTRLRAEKGKCWGVCMHESKSREANAGGVCM